MRVFLNGGILLYHLGNSVEDQGPHHRNKGGSHLAGSSENWFKNSKQGIAGWGVSHNSLRFLVRPRVCARRDYRDWHRDKETEAYRDPGLRLSHLLESFSVTRIPKYATTVLLWNLQWQESEVMRETDQREALELGQWLESWLLSILHFSGHSMRLWLWKTWLCVARASLLCM